jgi:SAM-dependent MidA family methyltransferase
MANAITPVSSIRDRLSGGRHLPWRDVMEIALYEPNNGYYRQENRRIGRSGDFFTSVSVGPVFGELLSLYCLRVWRSLGSSGEFAVIEQGAHDGTLARDVMLGLEKHQPQVAKRVRYHIIEPDEGLQAAQRATLAEWEPQVSHASALSNSLDLPRHAVFLCNELLDAFPVHRVVFDAASGQWQESYVKESAAGLMFVNDEPGSAALREEINRLPREAPDGCVTEINLGMLRWLQELAHAPFTGSALILDYGYTNGEWLQSGSTKGTLCRYRNHHTDDRILEDLGECDLTSHVNFTRLGQEAESSGLPILEFIELGRFLSHTAAELFGNALASPDTSWLRQFQTLTHPGMMGRSFHALTLGKGTDATRLAIPEKQAASRQRLEL